MPAEWRKGWVVEVWRAEGLRLRRWAVREVILVVIVAVRWSVVKVEIVGELLFVVRRGLRKDDGDDDDVGGVNTGLVEGGDRRQGLD